MAPFARKGQQVLMTAVPQRTCAKRLFKRKGRVTSDPALIGGYRIRLFQSLLKLSLHLLYP